MDHRSTGVLPVGGGALNMPADLFKRCIQASASSGLACERVLASDVSYTQPGAEPYDRAHLAIVGSISVCALVVGALREGDADIELLRWCAEICSECSTLTPHASVPAADWAAVVTASRRCARLCLEVVDRVQAAASRAIGAGCDTDFHSLEAPGC